jgi:hypothetical protein
MEEIKTSVVPKYYIEFYDSKTKKLTDISEVGYDSLELCQTQIDFENKVDQEFEQEIMAQYEEDLKNFVLDLDTSDREPINPSKLNWRYDKKPGLYLFGENGHVQVTPRAIDNLDSLLASRELVETINSILNDTIDPKMFSMVREWIDACYSDPCADELKMLAINQALGGYGIESVRTSKWKNGHWCDILCTYVNMGDSYIPTLIHHRKHGFMVASIGDVIEKNKHVF